MKVPVIMAGGSGSRLWPVSRASYPKTIFIPEYECNDPSRNYSSIHRLFGLPIGETVTIFYEDHRFCY